MRNEGQPIPHSALHTPQLISVITPSFNHAKFIAATIRSVADQDYPHVEHIVMDGGSTDGTRELLEAECGMRNGQFGLGSSDTKSAISDPHPPAGSLKFRHFIEPDAGQADAINKGIARSSGAIVGWLNSDDLLVPGALSAVARYFADHPAVALVYGNAEFIDARGRSIGPCTVVERWDADRLRNVGDFIIQPAAFFRRDAFDAVGGLDASLHFAMDWDLWLKLAARFEVAYLPRVLARYRWQGQNKSATGAWRRMDEIAGVARRHGIDPLPAYFALEKVALHLATLARERKPDQLVEIFRTLLRSPRAMRELLDPHTWEVIATGQTLRRRARRQSRY